jgi:hypothetical protein
LADSGRRSIRGALASLTFKSGFGQVLGVLDRHVLRSPVAVVDEATAGERPAIMQRLLESVPSPV